MRTVISLLSGGVAQLWQRMPRIVKVPLVVFVLLATGAELGLLVNQAWFSNAIEKGKAAQSEAQASNIDATRAAVTGNKPATGADRQIAATVFGLEADAELKQNSHQAFDPQHRVFQ
jgi:hypothetical protein